MVDETGGPLVLVVEDEPALRDVVEYNLRQAGFTTVSADDGRQAVEVAETSRPDLVVLDLMLPGLDGLTVCRILRQRLPDLPVIMLTARDSELERVLGLELGADDYVTKPFSPRELVARVRAVLRRARPDATATRPAHGGGGLPSGRAGVLAPGLCIDFSAREVLRNGQPVDLTPTEFRLLEALAVRPGQALTRVQLFEQAWGEVAFGDERTVDVHIHHLREKLEDDPSQPKLILTVRGHGYRLKPQAPAGAGAL